MKLLFSAFLFAFFSVYPATCSAEDAEFQRLDAGLPESEAVVRNALQSPDRGIPNDLLRRCKGIAIFPGVLRVGLLLGASFGKGVVLRFDEKSSEWSKPTFFNIRTGSFGLQVGAQSTDLILLIMTEQGVQHLLEEKFILGADISVAAGPVGREAGAETNLSFESGILSYSRSKGFFAGISLNGASLSPDKRSNEVYHGPGISVQDVFYEGKGTLTENGKSLINALRKPDTKPN